MAIHYMRATVIKRSAGRSAVAAAAYRAEEHLRDERTAQSHDYRGRRRDSEAWIQAPDNAPDWARNREQLWNAVEEKERRKDSQLAREFVIAIPRELDADARRTLLHRYVQAEFTERGMVADVALHVEDRDNPHAHVMLTMREIDEHGFQGKQRAWNNQQTMQNWREAWTLHANYELEMSGRNERIDHRSYAERGIAQEPGIHLGPHVAAMEERGIETEIGSRQRDVDERNRIALERDLAAEQERLAAEQLAAVHARIEQERAAEDQRIQVQAEQARAERQRERAAAETHSQQQETHRAEQQPPPPSREERHRLRRERQRAEREQDRER